MSTPELIDAQQLSTLAQTMGDGFDELKATFEQDLTEFHAKLVQAYSQGRATEMHLPAHSIKSTARTFGLSMLGDLSEEIEQLSKQNQLASEVQMSAFSTCLNESLQALKLIVRA